MARLAPLRVSLVKGAIVTALGYAFYPEAKSLFTKFYEDAFTTHFGCRYPGGALARDGRTALFRQLLRLGEITGGLDACEADQCPHLSEPLDQDDLLEHLFVAGRRFDGGHLEITR